MSRHVPFGACIEVGLCRCSSTTTRLRSLAQCWWPSQSSLPRISAVVPQVMALLSYVGVDVVVSSECTVAFAGSNGRPVSVWGAGVAGLCRRPALCAIPCKSHLHSSLPHISAEGPQVMALLSYVWVDAPSQASAPPHLQDAPNLGTVKGREP